MSAKRRRPHGKRRNPLAKRRHASRAKKAVRQITAELSGGGAAVAAGQVTPLRSAIQSLRKDLSGAGATPAERTAAAGLQSLDDSLRLLGKAGGATDPNSMLTLLAEGHAALQTAQKRAKKAGHAWPL